MKKISNCSYCKYREYGGDIIPELKDFQRRYWWRCKINNKKIENWFEVPFWCPLKWDNILFISLIIYILVMTAIVVYFSVIG